MVIHGAVLLPFSVLSLHLGDNSSPFLKSIEDTLPARLFSLCLAKQVYINLYMQTFAAEVCYTQIPVREDTAPGGECSSY